MGLSKRGVRERRPLTVLAGHLGVLNPEGVDKLPRATSGADSVQGLATLSVKGLRVV